MTNLSNPSIAVDNWSIKDALSYGFCAFCILALPPRDPPVELLLLLTHTLHPVIFRYFRDPGNGFLYPKDAVRYGSITAEFGETPGFRVWRGRPLATMPFHWHDQVEINYAVGGSLTYLLAGSIVRVPPGRLSVFWAGMPHSVVDGGGIEDFYWAYVPLTWALGLDLPNAFTRRVMAGELVVDADPHESDRPMLDRWCEELPEADEARARLVVREVESRLMRLALGQPATAGGERLTSGPDPVRKVSEMARFVALNYDRPLCLADVARHVGLHPNYAMTLFRRHYGITLNTYLTHLRVCQAQHLLLSTGQDISRIAFETGFGSISRFYEAFKAVSGKTPGQYRMLPKLL